MGGSGWDCQKQGVLATELWQHALTRRVAPPKECPFSGPELALDCYLMTGRMTV